MADHHVIELSGSTSVRVTGKTVTIEIDRITNISRTATTGPLNVILRFTTDSMGAFISPGNGHNAARESLSYLSNDGTLAPGESYEGVRFTTDYQAPLGGNYQAHLVVSQSPNLDTVQFPSLDTLLGQRTITFSDTVTFGENKIDALTMRPNDLFRAVFSRDNYVDDWKFTLLEPGVVTLQTMLSRHPLRSIDYTIGRLENANGVQLAEDNDSGTNPNFQIQETLPAGTYYLRVTAVPTEYFGDEEYIILQLDFEPDATSDVESGTGNDIRGGASILRLHDIAHALISSAGDVDYWQFTLTEPGTVTLETSGGIGLGGYLEDARGVLLAESHSIGNYPNTSLYDPLNFQIQETLPAGTYYIRVTGGRRNDPYTLYLDFDPDSDRSSNPRDGAPTLRPNDVVHAMISPAGDVDYWQFTLTEPSTVTLETSGVTSNTIFRTIRDIVGRLEDARGVPLAEDDDSGTNLNFQIQETLPAGTYYIRVTGYDASFADYYILGLDFGPDSDENNTRDGASILSLSDGSNTRDDASTLQPNDVVHAMISPANDVDYWQFTLTEPDIVTLKTTSGGTDTVGWLEDARGVRLAEDDDSGTRLNFQIQEALPAGTYYIRVTGFDTRRSVGDYTLSLNFEPDGSGSGNDENISCSFVGNCISTLPLNSLVRGTISPMTPPDTDEWEFVLTESGVVTLETSGSTDTLGELYDDSYTGVMIPPISPLAEDDDSGSNTNFRIQEALPAGFYIIRVAGYDGRTGDYTLSLNFEPDRSGGGEDYTAAQERRVVEAYIAYYGRPPDQEGLAYWAQRLAGSGGSLNSIIQAFGVSEEFERRFGSLSNRQLVTNLYQQLFGRNPDSGGLDFYVNRLNNGITTLQAIAISILDGAQNDDRTIIENRRDASNCFLEYSQLSSVSIGAGQIANILSSVDHRDSTVEAACNSYEGLLL